MRTVAINELSGIELDWVFSRISLKRMAPHENEECLHLVEWSETRRDPVPQKTELSSSDSFAFLVISSHRLSVTAPQEGEREWVVTGFSDPSLSAERAYNPRPLEGRGNFLREAVFRAICSYEGAQFEIPDDIAKLHDKNVEADRAFWEEMEDGPTMDELRAMGVFDGKEFQ